MAMEAALARLRTLLCAPPLPSSRRSTLLLPPSSACPSPPSRFITHSAPALDDVDDLGNAADKSSQAGSLEDVSASPSDPIDENDDDGNGDAKAPVQVKVRPYAEKLREQMVQKYLANQPIPKPHRLCRKKPMEKEEAEEGVEKKKKISDLHNLRVEYRKQVSDIRKEYARELERQKAAKATQDKKQREEILRAKEERIRLKKEKSKLRALEVESEKQLLQEQLAKETAERRLYRKQMDLKVEERRQRERDIIRQQSGTWINEEHLEEKIVQALANPIDL